ncbi:Rieske 2Fe-2S domain-containing protein [Aetokthonos hydrillicola Thurmond2011]|jgi:phenylpropionate dioxygenase-like ring-hydroxylating dioxygenase large terminal subunit|uniref:Rieske 2Fe-2S domain-containing protein n=1 Tax=Aetokthonos hydrillicola Thurmond2011 TaxID=2712845 RepID=A0AAP5IAF4_9CYAN|nr:Rieske 2Fe-2S domain-containing protein [Aetokthonos hydrillicola]MBO3459487.1 Rieske 2Fe-2S domain-containing protein [Aetokthonos hydrillicola CCALA 1050]MBW4583850.1 Rieske 2Fe-2S domain-containing protein [Aetokthonos hydrillicola CCALA 1050]MDR9895455.1 Rieske 2Fe-2S domain-containing protein [Aetokthonos hydrillicola Thurmond2011]
MKQLQGAPWLLAHRSMLKPNKLVKISLLGNDYVLWQNSNGVVRALPNACPHMGAMLSEGWCVKKPDGNSVIACPFHALEFDHLGCTVIPGSNKKTQSLIQPLELIIQDNFIWSYGGYQPKIPIPNIMNEIATEYEFIGVTGNRSIPTDILSLLLNMHDYNHQNGTHRELFEIEQVHMKEFIDEGLHSHAYLSQPRKKPTLSNILKNPGLLAMPKVLEVHLENFFPFMGLMHGENNLLSLKECHFYLPENANQSRVFVLMYMKAHSAIAHLIKGNLLKLINVVVEQDANILSKIYPDTPQRIKLNNEVGMNWVRRNFESFPSVAEQNLSQ